MSALLSGYIFDGLENDLCLDFSRFGNSVTPDLKAGDCGGGKIFIGNNPVFRRSNMEVDIYG